jgi:hypothetical protein
MYNVLSFMDNEETLPCVHRFLYRGNTHPTPQISFFSAAYLQQTIASLCSLATQQFPYTKYLYTTKFPYTQWLCHSSGNKIDL